MRLLLFIELFAASTLILLSFVEFLCVNIHSRCICRYKVVPDADQQIADALKDFVWILKKKSQPSPDKQIELMMKL